MTNLSFYGGVGEIGGKELLETVSEIDAKTLYPIHTEHPEEYQKVSKNVILAKEGSKYDIA